MIIASGSKTQGWFEQSICPNIPNEFSPQLPSHFRGASRVSQGVAWFAVFSLYFRGASRVLPITTHPHETMFRGASWVFTLSNMHARSFRGASRVFPSSLFSTGGLAGFPKPLLLWNRLDTNFSSRLNMTDHPAYARGDLQNRFSRRGHTNKQTKTNKQKMR